MKEAYVSFETAKHLKEKGFDWEVRMYYAENGDMLRDFLNNFNSNALHGGGERVSAPTQQMAMRWLREEKGIHILPEISEVKENPKYYCMIWNTTNLESFIVDLFGSYEDAVEAALQYVLTKLI